MSAKLSVLESHVIRPRKLKSKTFIADMTIHEDVIYLVGGTNHEPAILASSDAIHFHEMRTPNTPGLRSILAQNDRRLFVCGEYGALYVSTNLGDDWKKIETGTQACLFALERDASGEMWVAGDDGFVLRSKDAGVTWSTFDARTRARIGNVVADGDTLYFLCADGALIARKDDAVKTVFTGRGPLTDVLRTPLGLFVSGDRGQLFRSTDGETFEPLEAAGADVDLEAMTYGAGGLFVVGSYGTLLRSQDGVELISVDSTTRDHFFCAHATGSGLFIGGEGGAFLHVRTRDDATWSAHGDTLVEAAGELDALFLESDLDTFLKTGLVELVGGVTDGPYPGAAEFEAIWGTRMPDELGALLEASAKGAAKVLYEWHPAVHVEHPPPDVNLFEHLVVRDQERDLGTSLIEALTGQLYLGAYGNGDSHLASVYGDEALVHGDAPAPSGPRAMRIFDHEEHDLAFETARSVSRFAYFSALCRAIREQRVSGAAAKKSIERVRDSITPSWHFRSTIEEAGIDELEGFAEERPHVHDWYVRSLWIVHLLRKGGVDDLGEVERTFVPAHNPPLRGDVHERWTKSAERLVPTALYGMLRCFLFDDPRLDEYLAIGRAHPSRLARDCARVIDDTLAGRRKALGKIRDLLELRDAFQKLDLDPEREEARQAEAAERARIVAQARAEAKALAMTLPDPTAAAWSALEDLRMQEAIEARLRGEPNLDATFAAIDFVLGQKFVRENLVLDHERDEELEWLGMHGDPAVLPLLLGSLVRARDDDEQERPRASEIAIHRGPANAVGRILIAFGERSRLDERARPVLRRLLETKEKYEWRRACAVMLLGLLRDVESLPALEQLAAWLPTGDYGEAIARKDLAVALPRALRHIGDARAIPMLTTMLESSDRTASDARAWVAEALGTLGAVSTWREIMRHAASTDRKPAAWLLWSAGMLGATADDATKRAIAEEVQRFKPKWSVSYLELVRQGVLARLGAPPESLAATLEQALTNPGHDGETTSLHEAWAMRIVGVTDASLEHVRPFLRRDDPMLRRAAREALERRGEKVPAARHLHRAEVARIEREGGVNALIAAFSDENAIYRHVAASRLGEVKAAAAREPLLHFVREIVARTPRHVGAKLPRDRGYPLRWALRALLDLEATAEVVAAVGTVLAHPSRDVKDPALRYAKRLPVDPALIEPMLRVAEEKWGWQETAANEWLVTAKAKLGRDYDDALSRLRRPS